MFQKNFTQVVPRLQEKALQEALARYKLEQLELKHRLGYEKKPVNNDEFSVWETEQDWGDE